MNESAWTKYTRARLPKCSSVYLCVGMCECEAVMQPLGVCVLVESEPLLHPLLSLAHFRHVLSLVFSSTALKSGI